MTLWWVYLVRTARRVPGTSSAFNGSSKIPCAHTQPEGFEPPVHLTSTQWVLRVMTIGYQGPTDCSHLSRQMYTNVLTLCGRGFPAPATSPSCTRMC